ncbi:MAG: SGNH/GDSL hydrolase family protein, partial [Pseudomonadota bacterium]
RSAFAARPFENRASEFADCEECSFAYTLARNLGVRANNIFVAGRGGRDIQDLDNQLRQVALPLGHLPETVLVSFTANSICGEQNADRTAEDRYEWYKKRMRSRLTEALGEVEASPRGTKFLVVAAADVGNLLTNENVLSRPIFSFYPDGSFSRSMTCRDMRTGQHATTNGSGRDVVAGMCKYLMYTRLDDTERIAHIESLHSAVVQAQREITQEFQEEGAFPNVSFQFLDSILDIDFAADDVSPDCFHPSTMGHDKIAKTLLEEIQQ